MQARVIRSHVLDDMKREVLSGSLAFYRGDGAFPFGTDDLLVAPFNLAGPVPAMSFPGKLSERAAADAEHAIAIYQCIGRLEEAQARDARLWSWLTHAVFHGYCRERWPLPGTPDQAKSSVISHWFLDGKRGPATALRRNAIARLWWATHLTRAPWEYGEEFAFLKQEDEFAFTRVLLSNQDVFQGTLERQFGSSRSILIALLEVLRRDMGRRSNSAFVNDLSKRVNLNSRFRELSAIKPEGLVTLFERLASAVPVSA